MAWSTTAPSGITWSGDWVTGREVTHVSEYYNFRVQSRIGRGAENKIAVAVRLQVEGWNYGKNYPYVTVNLKAQVSVGNTSSWSSSDFFACSGPYGAWNTAKTWYYTGTASANALVYARAYLNSGYQSLPTEHRAPEYKTTYSITYNANGGSGTTASQTKTYGTSLTLRSNGFTRAGWGFTSWNTKADGTGTSYNAGASYTANAAATLYAQWTPQQSLILSLTPSAETQGAISLQMDRKVSTYWHKAVFSSGGVTLLTSDAFETSLSTTVPRSWFDNFPNSATISVTVSVTTYTDSACTTQVGSAVTGTVSVTADAGMVPSAAAGWAAAAPYNTGAVSGLTGYIRGYSSAEVTFDATKITCVNNATVASYKVACQGETVTASPYRTPVLSSTGSVSVAVTVLDSRGRSASETLTVSVMDYAAPMIKNVEIFHCDQQGEELDGGYYLSVKATALYSALNGQNSVTMSVAIASAGGSYGSETAMTSGTAVILSSVSPNASWDVRITVEDALGTTVYYYETIPTQSWAMKFRANGSGVGFGKAPESDDLFEIDDSWAVKSKGIVDLIYPVGSIFLSVTSVDPNTVFGGTWVRIEDTFLLAAGSTYSPGATGGEANHTLTATEMPSHRHEFGRRDVYGSGSAAGAIGAGSSQATATYYTSYTGGGGAHNNMPPYLAVYVWKRTA